MKKKTRNELRKGYMKNYSTYILERYIIIDNDHLKDNEKDKIVNNINEELWYAIQETNMYANGRILPYVIVRRVEKVNEKLRIIVSDTETQHKLEDCDDNIGETIDIDQLSHLIIFKTIEPRKEIQVYNGLLQADAQMIVSPINQIAAAVDIFLDIAMYNSISFLRNKDLDFKKSFSKQKYDYARIKKWDSYFDINEANPPAYWSFAFSVRVDPKTIQFDRYVVLWDMFLRDNYPTLSFTEKPLIAPHQQMEFHIDKNNIQKKYFDGKFWSAYSHNDYLLLRVNKKTVDKKKKDYIGNLFKLKKIRIGAIKILQIDAANREYIRELMKELYISAFKIVV